MARPPKYNTPEEMQSIIDFYFSVCFARQDQDDVFFEKLSNDEKLAAKRIRDTYPTVCGLASALGMSRQALLDYEKKDEFLDTIKDAKQFVESVLEQRLFFQSPTGAIFNLKNNFGWKDAQDLNNRYVDEEGKDLHKTDRELLNKLGIDV